MKLLAAYLRDRLHWVVLTYVNTLIVIALGALLLQIRGIDPSLMLGEAGYLLLLASFVLALFLAYDLIRWWPFAVQHAHLLETPAEADALVNLPDGGNGDQRAGALLLRKLHGRFAAERARHEEAHERHRSFIHLWVHQMKTPVSLVGLIANREGDSGTEQVRGAMASVEEQAAKISEGLDLVLHMARLQEFAVDYQVRRVDLAQLVRQVVAARKKQFIRTGIFPRFELETEETTVLSDAKWLAFALDQVVGNALKYGAQAERVEQALTITLRREEQTLTLTITDQGPGIPPEDLPRVFDPFFTGENGRRFAGATGVGLYLVRRVMDELGHTIAIDSAPGAGTTVTFRFVTQV